jgi:hypothetical protein
MLLPDMLQDRLCGRTPRHDVAYNQLSLGELLDQDAQIVFGFRLHLTGDEIQLHGSFAHPCEHIRRDPDRTEQDQFGWQTLGQHHGTGKRPLSQRRAIQWDKYPVLHLFPLSAVVLRLDLIAFPS